jgi:hypothetical protein
MDLFRWRAVCVRKPQPEERFWGCGNAGPLPEDLYTWWNLTTTFLRRDLDVVGLDSYDFDLDSSLLARLQDELESAHRRHGRERHRSG